MIKVLVPSSRGPMDDEALERRRARADWPVRKFHLGEEPIDDFSAYTAEERLAMTWQMTCYAWASAGLPMPTYSRSEMPIRVIRKRSAGDVEEQGRYE